MSKDPLSLPAAAKRLFCTPGQAEGLLRDGHLVLADPPVQRGRGRPALTYVTRESVERIRARRLTENEAVDLAVHQDVLDLLSVHEARSAADPAVAGLITELKRTNEDLLRAKSRLEERLAAVTRKGVDANRALLDQIDALLEP